MNKVILGVLTVVVLISARITSAQTIDSVGITCLKSNLSHLSASLFVTDAPSLLKGIGYCSQKDNCGVLVAAGEYRLAASMEIPSGVHLYGGCVDATVQTTPTASIVYSPPGGLPVATFNNARNPRTGLEGFVLIGSDANFEPKSSRPSAVLYARHSVFSLTNVRIVAGTGGDGAPGYNGAPGVIGPVLTQASLAGRCTANATAPMNEGAPPFTLQDAPWQISSAPWIPWPPSVAGNGFPFLGARGGQGGQSGGIGGPSLGILMIDSQATLSGMRFVAGRAGAGGKGGDGGVGAQYPTGEESAPGGGGAGGLPGPTYSILYSPTSKLNFIDEALYSSSLTYNRRDVTRPGKGGHRGIPKSFTCPAEAAPDGHFETYPPVFKTAN